MSMDHDEYIDLSVDNIDDTEDIEFDTYNDEIRIDPALKTHLDDGDKLVWYKDPTIIATWHSNGKLDVPCFDATDVTISAVNFRILKGHWRNKDEHGVGTESNHWLFNDRPISEYLELYPDFWKANEINTVQPKKERKPRQKKETSDKTSKVSVSEHEDIVKEYKYESEKLLYGSDFSELYSEQLRREATPSWVVKDMISLLPDNIWNPYSKFLDIYCKSGIFLEVIIDQLMSRVDYSVIDLYEPKDIYRYIIENQIYALCWKKEYADVARTSINGKVFIEKNIKLLERDNKYITDKEFRTKFREIFGNMKIDAVVGNPPYNNDIYIPFVEMGHNLASTCSVFITPAKWQAKGGEKNEAFRQNIVPHMSKIVYYPDCSDVFRVMEYSGISYYLINKNDTYENKEIKNISHKNKNINSTDCRQLDFESTLRNDVYRLLKKINNKDFKRFTFRQRVDETKKYSCVSPNNFNPERGVPNTYQVYGMMSYTTKNMTVVQKLRIIETNDKDIKLKNADRIVFTSDNIKECQSFNSYVNLKLIRYIISARIPGLSPVYDDNTWRFVPDPGAFDHIFTDEELYKKYNLTPEEINIIESVIKERK